MIAFFAMAWIGLMWLWLRNVDNTVVPFDDQDEDWIDIKSEILFSYEDIALLAYEKFQSGNDVPVDQITIKRSEIESQLKTLDFYKEAL